jgi:hypothetical protein
VIGSSLAIPSTAADGVEEDDKVDEDDEDGDECPTGHARMCCRLKPAGEQRQPTRGAGRLPGLLVGPDPSVNGPRSSTHPGLESLGMPPDPVPDQEGVIY